MIHSVGTEGLWVSVGSCSALRPGTQRLTAEERRYAYPTPPFFRNATLASKPRPLCLTDAANHQSQELWAGQLQSWVGVGRETHGDSDSPVCGGRGPPKFRGNEEKGSTGERVGGRAGECLS